MATATKTLVLTLSLLLLSTTLSFSLVTQRREEDRRRELQQCRERCREGSQGHGQQQRQCEEWCQERYEQEREQHRQRNQGRYEEAAGEEEEEWGPSGGGRESRNPYVFKEESIRHHYRSEQGSIRILDNFLRKSKLHLGIANYRIAFLEANPRTFAVPTHFDADEVLYVMRGEGTVSLIRQDKQRESHDIREGDIIKVSAGTVMYLINRSNNQKLQIVKLLVPVSTPGRFEGFFTVGGDQPESYLRAFSNDLLQAALNSNKEDLQRVFGQQRQGIIVKATEQQIRSLQSGSSSSEHETHWPFGGGRGSGSDPQSRIIHLFDQRPLFSNRHGKLHEVDPEDFRQLRDVDVSVSYANITSGSMFAPYFNSRATKVAIVRNGRGRLEIVCPHLSEEERRRGGGSHGREEEWEGEGGEQGEGEGRRFQLVSSEVTKDTVYIVPAGHPFTLLATGDENYEAVCFEINARDNQKNFLTGRDNVVSKMEKVAQELAFGVPGELVERVFGKGRQQEQGFLPGPEKQQQQQQRERQEESRRPVQSILEV